MRKIDVPNLNIEPDPGPAPMLQWIEIDALVVDEAYQRDLGPRNWAAIRRIAENFKWSRFSPVFVAPVEGGGIRHYRRPAPQPCCGDVRVQIGAVPGGANAEG